MEYVGQKGKAVRTGRRQQGRQVSQDVEEWCDLEDPRGHGRRILVIVFLFAERKNSRDVVWDCLSQELDGSS